jgi:hypothetical protein
LDVLIARGGRSSVTRGKIGLCSGTQAGDGVQRQTDPNSEY